MKNKLIILFISLTILTGCFGDDEEKTPQISQQGYKLYNNTDFFVEYPDNWSLLSKDETNKISGLELLAKKDNIEDNFTPNLSILKVKSNDLDNIQIADKFIETQKTKLLSYQEISEEMVNLNNQDTKLFKFKGKEKANSDLVIFYQTYFSNDDYAFIITCSHNQKIQSSQECISMLNSFRLN